MKMDLDKLKAERQQHRLAQPPPSRPSTDTLSRIARARRRRTILRDVLETLWATANLGFFIALLASAPDNWGRAGLIIMIAATITVLPVLRAIRLRFRIRQKDRPMIYYLRDIRDNVEAQMSLERWYSWFTSVP
jgi:hypothetical protein